VDVAPGLTVRSDPQILRQVLANLLSNAVKFTENGEIRVVATPMGAGLSLSVVDTGIGIPEGAMDRLFQKFGQVDGSSTRRHGGTGLGLALCRELAALLGGTLTVSSKEGQGSTFTLELPALA
jgi:signal transduction histidine kinase